MVAPLDIWSCANAGDLKIKLTRQRHVWHQGRLLPPKKSVKNIFCFPPFLSDHLFPNSYTMKVFMILFSAFCFSLGWKDNAIIHILQAIARDKPTVGFAMMLMILYFFLPVTNFSLISNTSVSLEQAYGINTSG